MNQKKVELNLRFLRIYFSSTLVKYRSSLSLIVDAAHLSGVLIAADSLRRCEPAASRLRCDNTMHVQPIEAKSLPRTNFSLFQLGRFKCLNALHLKLAP